mgnify:CR=1 FL=1
MSILTFGIDPDSEAHGVAIFADRRLVALNKMNLMGLMECFRNNLVSGHALTVVVENVLANRFMYDRNDHARRAAATNIAMKVGRNQQAQIEVVRMCDFMGVPCKLIKPARDNWANDKARFERFTGWRERSNADTRSAAYFGFLGLDYH